MKSTDDKLKEVQKKIEEEMQKEEDLKEMVEVMSDDIYGNLLSRGDYEAEIDNRKFKFKIKYTESFVVIAAADMSKMKILQEKYKPFFIQAKIEEGFTLEEIVKACVKAFVGQQYGIIEAEEQQ